MTNTSLRSINAKTLIGGLLVAFGFAEQKAVDDAFAWQSAERAAGRDPGFLGAVLVNRQVCTAEQRDFALEVQKHLRTTFERTQVEINLDDKSLIGQLLVAFGFAEQKAIDDAFAWQKAEKEADRNPGFIGEILVSRGACTAEQRDFAMKVQNLLRGVA